MTKKKERLTWQKWISWVLQCLSYLVGISLAVKELFFKPRPTYHLPGAEKSMADKLLPPLPVIPTDWVYLVIILGTLITISIVMWRWRKKV